MVKSRKATPVTLYKNDTFMYWLMKIPDEQVKTRAIANRTSFPFRRSVRDVDSISDAILHGFNWSKTPEGYYYWGDKLMRY